MDTLLKKNMYKILDLFSGLGGFSLGLERTGCFKTIAFCDNDKFLCWISGEELVFPKSKRQSNGGIVD